MYSIELPWKDNLAQVSCIPEGKYEGIKRWNLKFNRHLQVMNVSKREHILIHPANDATHELKAVSLWSLITGAGKGIRFIPTAGGMKILTSLVYGVLVQHDHVFINKNQILMNLFERAVSPTPTFFQKLRNIGLMLTAISAAIISTPVAIPAVITTIAGYLAVAGTVLSGVSQVTIPEDK